jgi:20S proteasome alpha/beta subunit
VVLMLLFLLLLQLGSTAIGLKTKDGVVLAVEKRVTSPLLVLAESPFLLNWS